jgi:hypothetical protein
MKRLATLEHLFSADHVFQLMRDRRHKQQITETVLLAAFELFEPETNREGLLKETKAFFLRTAFMVPEGLEILPSCWLRRIPDALWDTCYPDWNWIPYMIAEFRLDRGVLLLRFVQEQPPHGPRLTGWDKVRIYLNLLQPNLWRPLGCDLERQIWVRRPDLQNELFRLPQ